MVFKVQWVTEVHLHILRKRVVSLQGLNAVEPLAVRIALELLSAVVQSRYPNIHAQVVKSKGSIWPNKPAI
jgi:hypothetical protein